MRRQAEVDYNKEEKLKSSSSSSSSSFIYFRQHGL